MGLALVVSAAWGAAGWTAGTLLRSATAAFAVILLWAVTLQAQLDQFAGELTRPPRAACALACLALPVILTRRRDVI